MGSQGMSRSCLQWRFPLGAQWPSSGSLGAGPAPGGHVIGGTDTWLRPRESDRGLVSPPLPALSGPWSWVPVGLSVWDMNEEGRSGQSKDGRSGACRQKAHA